MTKEQKTSALKNIGILIEKLIIAILSMKIIQDEKNQLRKWTAEMKVGKKGAFVFSAEVPYSEKTDFFPIGYFTNFFESDFLELKKIVPELKVQDFNHYLQYAFEEKEKQNQATKKQDEKIPVQVKIEEPKKGDKKKTQVKIEAKKKIVSKEKTVSVKK